MEIELLHIYGPYSSNITGITVLVDLLMPPKKCPLNCITCPLGATKISDHEIPLSISTTRIVEELSEALSAFKKSSASLDAIYIWGFGDPLVLSSVSSALRVLGDFIRNNLPSSKILLYTSIVNVGKTLKYSREIEDYVDIILVPYLWYGEDKVFLGWNSRYNLNSSLEALKVANAHLRCKIIPVVYTFKVGSLLYPDPQHLAETIAHLRSARLEEVIVKRVDRPSSRQGVKTVSKSYVKRVEEELVNAGFKVRVEEISMPGKRVVWRNTITSLYNYLLRLPLKHSEIVSLYGDLGVEALSNLVAKNLVIKIPWNGNIYYKSLII